MGKMDDIEDIEDCGMQIRLTKRLDEEKERQIVEKIKELFKNEGIVEFKDLDMDTYYSIKNGFC